MLCANALQLAVAKGLHRQVVSSWDLSEAEINQRSCIFWSAYCLEKQIVFQSGRPSVCSLLGLDISIWLADRLSQIIDDDEISSQLPTITLPGSSLNLKYCNTLISLAQLSSLAAKRLSSVQAFRTGAELLVKSVADLGEQLTALKRSIEPILSFDFSSNFGRATFGMSPKQIIYLQYSYFNTALNIHTFLTCPWIWGLLGSTPHLSLRSQLEKSTQIVAEICRTAIVATEHIHFDASTPVP
jgi:Fungal specific transcription factor domain